jgi:choline dehydrogenase-like flavoprotein
VCGSGVAGLVAARVLSDTFDEVLLLERDAPLLSQPGTSAAAAGDGDAAEAAAAAAGQDLSAALAAEVQARRRGVPQFTQPHVRVVAGGGGLGAPLGGG